MSWEPDDVHEAVLEVIEALEITDRYERQNAPDDAWRRATAPLKLQTEYSEASHLSFELDDSSSFDFDGQTMGYGLHVATPATIRFLWQIEVNDHSNSYKRLLAACKHILKTMINCPVSGLDTIIPESNQLWNISLGSTGDYYLAEVYITLRYTLQG